MIDLHTHSTCSDGTLSPAVLAGQAARAGLTAWGITDHDTAAGWDEARAAASAEGIACVRGTEFTTRHAGVIVHLLGYLFNPQSAPIAGHFSAQLTAREDRAREITARLSTDFPITWADVEAQLAPGAPVGRPHIADALVAAGVVASRSDAFADLLSTKSPYYVPQHAPTTTDVVAWINDAGGKAVLAHPLATQRGKRLGWEAIEEILVCGAFGVEVWHRENPPAERGELEALAGRLGKACFGSSDYHGSGKPNQLGEFTTSPVVLQALAEGTYLEV
ncbi:putative metal-dependent phosphoesterase TrpH [Arcanobacterium wilhelmae]|uniref:Metal-dependent phosphoesterase TrpH n=1 Tax=Arcanobacterium wilhelmae TaxID=1803177 RepID=A0ABT9ND88_9ACTO|nr:PHP domain-containing protein [Arcanobacterium wilhelmae]MDP9801483.1 putative metal-dependent phosphoesterase TrpH [Arcanobacterium wilhelmae]WFN90814.1 PHP domain-containing protein [Arcanobacterium wilhelmae]